MAAAMAAAVPEPSVYGPEQLTDMLSDELRRSESRFRQNPGVGYRAPTSVTQGGSTVRVGTEHLPGHLPTCFVSARKGDRRYTLADVAFLISAPEFAKLHGSYVKALRASEMGAHIVDFSDKDAVISWLRKADGWESSPIYKRSEDAEPPKKRRKLAFSTSQDDGELLDPSFGKLNPDTHRVGPSGAPEAVEPYEECFLLGNEIAPRSRSSLLRLPSSCTADFGKLTGEFSALLKSAKAQAREGKGRASGAAVPQVSRDLAANKTQHPIIIVPGAPSALINHRNAAAFLADMTWHDPQSEHAAASAAAAGGASGGAMTIRRTSLLYPQKRVAFTIVSDPLRLKPERWGQVIAVFALGKEWQFSGWPEGWNTPVEIFNKTCGFHVHYDDERPEPKVLRWKVERLRLSRTHRHSDKAEVQRFWDLVYRALRAHPNQQLLY